MALEKIVGQAVQSVAALGMERMAGPEKYHRFGVGEQCGESFGIGRGYQDVFSAGNDHRGDFELPEPRADVERPDRRQLGVIGSGRLRGRCHS